MEAARPLPNIFTKVVLPTADLLCRAFYSNQPIFHSSKPPYFRHFINFCLKFFFKCLFLKSRFVRQNAIFFCWIQKSMLCVKISHYMDQEIPKWAKCAKAVPFLPNTGKYTFNHLISAGCFYS